LLEYFHFRLLYQRFPSKTSVKSEVKD